MIELNQFRDRTCPLRVVKTRVKSTRRLKFLMSTRRTSFLSALLPVLGILAFISAPADETPRFAAELIFPLHHQHNHAPGIVECPNGDLLVSWYRGSGERNADDVAVYGARLRKGADRWSEPFLLADNPGFPDCNTTLFIDAKQRLWLFWPVILANTWESCLTNYRRATEYQGEGAPKWDWQGALYLKPMDFEAEMNRGLES